ncbi:FeoA family protein [Thermococcus sp. MAR1]|uniref:FeoA family protein n=1 Tax=Thermococcus sp. MAR1 TaxID=1638263 RepID=UPI00143BCF85|nr:FeoA family protein [Thermococcus sp. MAR1]NJE10571.1 ferrous iron transport protein A [Thermococcus sp. MAR1]
MAPLSFLNEGAKARIVQIVGGKGVFARLTALGLVPGREVRVVRNQMAGPLIVAVDDTQIALGRGLAMKILVEVE